MSYCTEEIARRSGLPELSIERGSARGRNSEEGTEIDQCGVIATRVDRVTALDHLLAFALRHVVERSSLFWCQRIAATTSSAAVTASTRAGAARTADADIGVDVDTVIASNAEADVGIDAVRAADGSCNARIDAVFAADSGVYTGIDAVTSANSNVYICVYTVFSANGSVCIRVDAVAATDADIGIRVYPFTANIGIDGRVNAIGSADTRIHICGHTAASTYTDIRIRVYATRAADRCIDADAETVTCVRIYTDAYAVLTTYGYAKLSMGVIGRGNN